MTVTSFARILVAVDVDEGAPAALDLARRVAELSGGRIHLAHVIVPNELEAMSSKGKKASSKGDWAERTARGTIETLAATHLDHRSAAPVEVRFGYAADVAAIVLEVATEVGADLLIVATHGRRGLERMALGSVAERIVRESPIPVLTVRARSGRGGTA